MNADNGATGPQNTFTLAPMPIRAVVALICGTLLLTAAGEAVIAVTRAPNNWASFGFAAVTVLTSVFGLLFAAGKLRDAPAFTLASVTAAIIVCSALGYLGMDRWLVASLSKKWWLVGRAAMTLGLLVCTMLVALRDRSPAWRSLAVSLLACVPLAAIAAWYRFAELRPLLTAMTGLAEGLRLCSLVALAVVALAGLCAMIHYGIRAFEIADESSDPSSAEPSGSRS